MQWRDDDDDDDDDAQESRASQQAYHKQSMSYNNNNNNNKPEIIRSTAGSPACLQLAFGQGCSRKQNRNIHKRFSVP
jgi:hypothetical protein